MTEENKNLFKEEEKKENFPSKNFKSKKGKVVNINKKLGKITIDVNGTGEQTKYIESKHANLKIGDPIEF